jgi:hypothetical protein
MSSIRDLNQRVILFVGRPSDSRKGLSLFFEAAEILTTLSGLPPFALWVVGGSPREVDVLSRMLDRLPSLRALREAGLIQLWGRVENSAISELYGRASVTVVPSYREEFGIVAVEAMMSGCPVVAARTGGLQDIVREGETGALFEPDDAAALAATLCGYLRNPRQVSLHSEAARLRAVSLFSTHQTLPSIARVYGAGSQPELNASRWREQSFYQEQPLTPERRSRLKGAFRDEEISVNTVSYGRHPVFQVSAGGHNFVAKFFTPRFSLQASLFPKSSSLSTERGGSISYRRVLFNKDNPIAPPTRYFEEALEPLIVSEWLPRFEEAEGAAVDKTFNDALRRCQGHMPLEDGSSLTRYAAALYAFASAPDDTHLESFDIASAELNARMTGGMLVLSRTHPQVELIRLRWFLDRRVWPLPEELRIRSTQVVGMLLEAEEIVNEKPLLAHGDPKPEHLILHPSGEIRMTDFEHSRYAVGPLDFSLWLTFTGVRGRLDTNATDVCERLCRQFEDRRERYLCACWVVSEVLFYALLRFSNGDRHELAVAQRFMKDLGMILFNRGVIR